MSSMLSPTQSEFSPNRPAIPSLEMSARHDLKTARVLSESLSLKRRAPRAIFRFLIVFCLAHSTAKCNGEIFDVEENLTRSSVAEYLSGTRVEFVLDPLDIGIRHNREIGTFWEVLSE